ADFRESRGETELAVGILERANQIHCKQSANVAINLASLLELQDQYEAALGILTSFDSHTVGNLMIYNRYIAILKRREIKYPRMERNEGKSVGEAYESLIRDGLLPYSSNRVTNAKRITENTRRSISSYYSMHYARYLRKVKGRTKVAMKVMKTAIVADPSNEGLYHALIDLHYDSIPLDIESIKDAFEQCINGSKTPLSLKVRISQWRIELFEEIGSDPKDIRQFTSIHKELLMKKKEKDFEPIETNEVKEEV
ncbi:hypothetical protein PFISCL1PPCAC_1860, partial [Pristionchus fissidentatus]